MKKLKKEVYLSVKAHNNRYENICNDLWKNFNTKDYYNVDFKKKMVLRDYHFYCGMFQVRDNKLLSKNSKERIYKYSFNRHFK